MITTEEILEIATLENPQEQAARLLEVCMRDTSQPQTEQMD